MSCGAGWGQEVQQDYHPLEMGQHSARVTYRAERIQVGTCVRPHVHGSVQHNLRTTVVGCDTGKGADYGRCMTRSATVTERPYSPLQLPHMLCSPRC